MEANAECAPGHAGSFVLLTGIILFTTPLRRYFLKHNNVLPIKVVLLVVGFAVGSILHFVEALHPYQCAVDWSAPFLIALYLPTFITATIYPLDTCTFIQCLPAGALIIVLGIAVYPITVGFVISQVLHQDWTLLQGVFVALACMPLESSYVILLLNDMFKHKQLGLLLQIESVMGLLPMTMGFKFVYGHQVGMFTEWYHFVCIFLRFFLLAVLVGYLMGQFNIRLLSWLYNQAVHALSVCVAMIYITYCFCEYVLATSGSLSIFCMVVMLGHEKHRLSANIDNNVTFLWASLLSIVDTLAFTQTSIVITIFALRYFTLKSLYGVMFLYLAATTARLVLFAMLSAIFSRMAVHVDLKCIIIMTLSDLKGPFNLCMIRLFISQPLGAKQYVKIAPELMAYIFLSTLLNSLSLKPIIRWIGMVNVPDERMRNMDGIMKVMMKNRDILISKFKNYRYLSNADWEVIHVNTFVSNPYLEVHANRLINEEEVLYGYTTCPGCPPNVPYDITEKELAAFIAEGRKKLLRAKKVVIFKHYENGLASKQAYELLVHALNSMIDSQTEVDHINVEEYMKKKKVLHWMTRVVMFLWPIATSPPPRKFFRCVCYYITMHIAYDFALYAVVVSYAVVFANVHDATLVGVMCTVVWSLFFVDLCLKLIALSHGVIILSGIPEYFRSKWNIYDFSILLLSTWNVAFRGTELFCRMLDLFVTVARLLILARIVTFFSPQIASLIEKAHNQRIMFGYELATVCLACCNEILEQLTTLLEMQLIQDIFRKDLNIERTILIQIMESVQRKWPWITTTVKTRKAISTTLTNMMAVLDDLKASGYVDKNSYGMCFEIAFQKVKQLRGITYVQSRSADVIFNDVPWMADDTQTIEFLYKHVQRVTWDAGEVIVRKGDLISGVYIIVTGMLSLRYVPASHSRLAGGFLPIVDFLSTTRLSDNFEETLLAGDVFGVLAVLTGRPYDCTIIAESLCQVYYLPLKVIHEALKLNSDPVLGLESRMWKSSVRNLAVAILMQQPQYASCTKEQINLKLERGFVPNLKAHSIFIITDMMEDVLLIDGVVRDYFNDTSYVAPIAISKITQKIHLEQGSRLFCESRLLIIPVEDADVYEIMETEMVLIEEESTDTDTRSMSCDSMECRPRRKFGGLLNRPSNTLLVYKPRKDKKIIVLDSDDYIPERGSTESMDRGVFNLLVRNTIITPSDETLRTSVRTTRISDVTDDITEL